MAKQRTQARRNAIVSEISQHSAVSVEVLAEQFETSEVTIRKDLATLEAAGLLLRRHGGAIALPQELSQHAHTPAHASPLKSALAERAALRIRDHNRLIIDSGSTTLALLPILSSKNGLVVMTNSLEVANRLRELENEPTLLMTGGTWEPRSESFQGALAEKMLAQYDFDQLFIGADGLDIERGTTTYSELYTLSREMAKVSREVVVMAESAKVDRKIHNLELPWSSVDVLITDDKISEAAAAAIRVHGVEVDIVNAL